MSSITPSPASSWANLPPDLLKTIADDHLDLTSSARLSVVCTLWASTIRPHLPFLPFIDFNRPIPWLLLSARQNPKTDGNNTHTLIRTGFTFYDISTANIYFVPINIPSLQGQRLLGSYKGWLMTADPPGKPTTIDPTSISMLMVADAMSEVQLIKPLTDALVVLPSFSRNCGAFMKAIMSDNIDELPVIFCLTEGGRLWMAKFGGERWTPSRNIKCFMDIIFYQGKVYATSWDGLCYYDPKIPTFCQWVTNINYNVPSYWNKYLFEWKGELFALLIHGNDKFGQHYTPLREVKLYKINLIDVACPLIEVTSLGNNALFFSPNCSYVLPASAFGSDGIRENCIYFTDQVSLCPCQEAKGFHPNHNFRVYNFGDKTITPFCPHGSQIHTTQPIFFSPR